MNNRRQLIPAIVVLTILSSSAKDDQLPAGDWPQWRGPNRDAVSEESGLLKSWPAAGPKTLWRAAGLGGGYSSVVVSNGLVFTIGSREKDVYCTAFEANTGRQRWSRKIGTTPRIPCSTPTVDGDRLYALDPDGNLVCLKAASGEVVWKKSFLNDTRWPKAPAGSW